MRNNFAALFASLFMIQHASATFNFTTCPASWELQTEDVQKNFDVRKMPGTYYELALHDYTQYPTCPKLSCIRSVKSFTDVGDGHQQLKDDFTIQCFGHPYTVEYFFNTTEANGSLMGFLVDPPAIWKMLFGSDTKYPDTVVAFKESEDGGQYDWIIEFQCRTQAGWVKGEHVGFTGINFYSRVQNPDPSVLEEMLQAGRDAGLGVYMDASWGTRPVPQTNCGYDDEEPTFSGSPLTN